jgi:hypothetical protein
VIRGRRTFSAERLRYAKTFYGMTFKQLERETHLRGSAISIWTIRSHFEGKTCPNADHLVMYADIFGVLLDYFTQLSPVRKIDGAG